MRQFPNSRPWCLVVDTPRHSSVCKHEEELRSDDIVESSWNTLEECEAAEKEWLLCDGGYCWTHNPNYGNDNLY